MDSSALSSIVWKDVLCGSSNQVLIETLFAPFFNKIVVFNLFLRCTLISNKPVYSEFTVRSSTESDSALVTFWHTVYLSWT